MVERNWDDHHDYDSEISPSEWNEMVSYLKSVIESYAVSSQEEVHISDFIDFETKTSEPSDPTRGEIYRSDGSWGASEGFNRWNGSEWHLLYGVGTKEETIEEGTITFSGGSSPAYDGNLGLSISETEFLDVILAPQGETFDYAYNYDWSQVYDSTSEDMDVNLTANWDNDPGVGNDVTINYKIIVRNILADGSITLSGGSSPAYDGSLGLSLPTSSFDIVLASQGANFDYAFNYDWGRSYDSSSDGTDINLTVNWDIDPGDNNDVGINYKVLRR